MRNKFFSIAFLLCITLLVGGCKPKSATNPDATPTLPPPPPAQLWKEFSGDKAFSHVRALVEMGPRPAGSRELELSRIYITTELAKCGWKIERQAFKENTPRGTLEFINLIARYVGTQQETPSDKTQQIILCSHYDTKTYSTISFVGANDGGSSTGALLEMARTLSLDPALAKKIELVFFDGEEAFEQFTETDGLYGSRYYARKLRETGRNKQFLFGILWDMIGDKDLTITLSPDSPKELVKNILSSAKTLGLQNHFTFHRSMIWDDHIPLNRSGIPTIDLIDFDYTPWHTADDTLDKLSPESLQKIGAVTLHLLRKTPEPKK